MTSSDGNEDVPSRGERKEYRRNRFSAALMSSAKSEPSSRKGVDSGSDDDIESSDLTDDDGSSRMRGALRRRFVPQKSDKSARSEHDKDKGIFRGVTLSRLAAPLKLHSFDNRDPDLSTKVAVSDIEKLAQKVSAILTIQNLSTESVC
jgi:hypothetical protein